MAENGIQPGAPAPEKHSGGDRPLGEQEGIPAVLRESFTERMRPWWARFTAWVKRIWAPVWKRLRKFISVPFLVMLLLSFTLWYAIKLGYTYQAEIPVLVNVDGHVFEVNCMLEGQGTRLFTKRHSKGKPFGEQTRSLPLDHTIHFKHVAIHIDQDGYLRLIGIAQFDGIPQRERQQEHDEERHGDELRSRFHTGAHIRFTHAVKRAHHGRIRSVKLSLNTAGIPSCSPSGLSPPECFSGAGAPGCMPFSAIVRNRLKPQSARIPKGMLPAGKACDSPKRRFARYKNSKKPE